MAKQSREKLNSAIWSIADGLRGSVDGWDFKTYVLGTMFYRFISEDIEKKINENEHNAGGTAFKYSEISDERAECIRAECINDFGYFLLPSQLFCNVVKEAESNDDLNITLENVFKDLESSSAGSASEADFSGLLDDFDVNSQKLGENVVTRNKNLVKLLRGVEEMELDDDGDNADVFGDAYEFLMGMYASQAGKGGGEYFTPAEVSELVTRLGTVGKTRVESVYDPACGSGSLLLKSLKVLGKDSVTRGFFGQEKNITTFNLCRINMFLHGVPFNKFSIEHGDTLINPQHIEEKPFELVVSNPPYSVEWEGEDDPKLINDPRYAPAGVLAPKDKSDFAFILHMVNHLASNGKAVVVCSTGILTRGGKELKIRQYLVKENFVEAVVQLPGNLFFGTGISPCIIVLAKNKKSTGTFFINASDEFIKDGNKNRLTGENINKIVSVFTSREEIKHFSHTATLEQIENNGFDLSVTRYVELEKKKQQIDLQKINAEIALHIEKINELREKANKIVAETEQETSE